MSRSQVCIAHDIPLPQDVDEDIRGVVKMTKMPEWQAPIYTHPAYTQPAPFCFKPEPSPIHPVYTAAGPNYTLTSLAPLHESLDSDGEDDDQEYIPSDSDNDEDDDTHDEKRYMQYRETMVKTANDELQQRQKRLDDRETHLEKRERSCERSRLAAFAYAFANVCLFSANVAVVVIASSSLMCPTVV